MREWKDREKILHWKVNGMKEDDQGSMRNANGGKRKNEIGKRKKIKIKNEWIKTE